MNVGENHLRYIWDATTSFLSILQFNHHILFQSTQQIISCLAVYIFFGKTKVYTHTIEVNRKSSPKIRCYIHFNLK